MKFFSTQFVVRKASTALLAGVVVTSLGACSITKLSDIPEYLDSEFEHVGPKEYISRDELNQIRLGMSPLEVQNTIGFPMLTDSSNKTNWDYIVKSGSGADEEYKAYRVYFKQDRVIRVAPLAAPPASIVDQGLPAEEAAPVAEVDLGAVEVIEAPEPTLDVAEAVDDAALINDALAGWAAAWSSQDVSSYFGFYADTFEHGKSNRSRWESSRTKMIENKSYVNVTLADINIDLQSDSLAVATFTQTYQSDKFTDTGKKELVMSKASGEWKIQKETFMK